MKNKYLPMAFMLEENYGCFAIRCKTKEQALKEIEETLKDYVPEAEYKPTLEQLKEQIYYHCGKCGYYCLDEAMCSECEKNLSYQKGKYGWLFEIGL